MLNTSNPVNEIQALDSQTTDSQISDGSETNSMTDKDFADLGLHEVVYVREVANDKAIKLFPEISDLPDGENLYAVHAADGTPILLAEDLETAFDAADEHSLTLHQLH